jgi:hypothetical protein
MEPKKFKGSIVFIHGALSRIKSSDTIINSTIDRAILSGNKLSIDVVQCEEQASGLIDLYSSDKTLYEGIFTYKGDSEKSADVKVVWYENNNALLLKGIWKESPEEWTVIIHLKEVESF